MKHWKNSIIITTGLAIFSMLFGAGNLMFPIKVGLAAGNKNIFAIAGFLLTAICLPLAGLISIMLFDGNYHAFFRRPGKRAGEFLIFFCMLIIGPLIAMPRIVTLSYEMVSPFVPGMPLFIFSIIFLVLTFLGTYKENKIIQLLGNYITPILVACLGIIIITGLVLPGTISYTDQVPLYLFLSNMKYGFNTMDLLGTIFFSAIIIHILKSMVPQEEGSEHNLAIIGLKAGALGTALLGIVYLGLSYLGVFHGYGLELVSPGKLFSAVSFRILGSHGALIIATAVLLACFSTIIALAAVVAEYLEETAFKNKIHYMGCLIMVLAITALTSNFGLSKILEFSAPILSIGYPVIITVTLCNLGYKLFGFKPIKIPTVITLILATLAYFR